MTKITKFFVGASIAVLAFVASADAAYMHTGMLRQGARGTQVMSLQQTLNANGYLVASVGAGSPGMETMTFGPATKRAVMAFQASKGLQADGIVGLQTGTALAALSHGSVSYPAGCTSTSGFSSTTGLSCSQTASYPAGCTSTSGFSSTTGLRCDGTSNNNNNNNNTPPTTSGLNGTDGSISDVNLLSQYSNEEVGEGENNVKVLGFEVEATNDGDIALRSVRVTLDPAGNGSTDSDHLDDYLDRVTVWMNDTQIGSADADAFTENSDDTYTRTISLNSSAIVRADDTENFYVAVDAVDGFDSGDIDSDSWTVNVDNIRYIDGSGVTTTEATAGDLPFAATDISFVTFSTSADTELRISTDSDSPEAGIVMIDDENNTDDVVLLKGKIRLDGSSDVVLDELPVLLTVTGATDVDNITGSITLVIDGEEYTESVSTSTLASATVTFDNLELTLEAGQTVSFEVRAEVGDIETGFFDEGDTLTASVNASMRALIDAENEAGDQLSASEKTGTATGEALEFRTEGIAVALVSVDESVSTGTAALDDSATFTIRFKVTAVGDDVYLASTVTNGYTYSVDYSGTATTTDVSAVVVNNTDDDVTSGGLWLIEEGESETITLTIVRSASATSDLYRAALTGIKWDTDGATPLANTYSSNLDDYKTDYVFLN